MRLYYYKLSGVLWKYAAGGDFFRAKCFAKAALNAYEFVARASEAELFGVPQLLRPFESVPCGLRGGAAGAVYRVLKSCLKARPCFVWTQGSIRGHFLICYLALVKQRLLERQLKEAGIKATGKEILSAISSTEVMEVKGKVQTIYIKREVDPLYDQLAKLLGMEPLRSRNTNKDIKNALQIK